MSTKQKQVIACALVALGLLISLAFDRVADLPEPQRSPAYWTGSSMAESLRNNGAVKPSDDQIDALAHGSGLRGFQVQEFKAGFNRGWIIAE